MVGMKGVSNKHIEHDAAARRGSCAQRETEQGWGMKRDLELIRKMVLTIEDSPDGWAPHPLEIDGYSQAQIGYHAYLLVDAGLAQGQDVTTNDSSGPEAFISSLTWKGHEFADAARDDGRWAKAMGVVQEKGGAITLGVLTQLLVSLMKGAFGL